MTNAARAALIFVLLAAPWWFGGVTPPAQFWLGAGVVATLVLWVCSLLLQPTPRPIPEVLIPVCLILLMGVIQLVPLPGGPGVMHRAELAGWLPEGLIAKPANGPISAYPAATRHELCRLLLATAVLLMSADLFKTRLSRMYLYLAITANGCALALFGIVQKLNWNGMLFGHVPISHGQPFASYVNRNNAAGYLNLCLASGVALLVLTYRRSRSDGQTRPIDEHWEPFSDLQRMLPNGIAILLGLIVLGVTASASRGGIVSVIAMAISVMLLAALSRYRRLVFGGLIVASIAIVLSLGWLGFGRSVGARLATLRQLERIADARPAHWSDAFRAVLDFPWAGTGLGTYHYANRPYQSHVSSGWYYNADNEYVEWLVEGGLITAGLGLWLLALMLEAAIRLIRSIHGVLDAGIALLLLLVGQCLQALTDFGISVFANLLLAAAICGMASGTTFRIRENRHHPRTNIRLAPTWTLVLGGLLLAGVNSLSLRELWTKSQAYQIVQSTPDPARFEQADPIALATLPEAARTVLGQRPDDAELHLFAARLYLHQLRQGIHEQLRVRSREPADRLWTMTHPSTLLIETLRGLDAGEGPLISRLSDSETQDALRNCREHLHKSQRACRLIPDVNLLLACLDVESESARAAVDLRLRRELALSPSDVDLFHRTATLASSSRLTDLAASCWKRELRLDPERIETVLTAAIPVVGESVVLEKILPTDSAVALIEFAKLANNRRHEALKRASTLIRDASAETSDSRDPHLTILNAQIAELEGNTQQAIEWYQRAIANLPLDIKCRLRLADLLEREGRVDEAFDQVKEAARLFPFNREIKSRYERLSRPL